MADLKEQHVCIKFCFKRRKNGAETFKMMKVAFWRAGNGKNSTFLSGLPSSKTV
jgi:hypothetical protein